MDTHSTMTEPTENVSNTNEVDAITVIAFPSKVVKSLSPKALRNGTYSNGRETPIIVHHDFQSAPVSPVNLKKSFTDTNVPKNNENKSSPSPQRLTEDNSVIHSAADAPTIYVSRSPVDASINKDIMTAIKTTANQVQTSTDPNNPDDIGENTLEQISSDIIPHKNTMNNDNTMRNMTKNINTNSNGAGNLPSQSDRAHGSPDVVPSVVSAPSDSIDDSLPCTHVEDARTDTCDTQTDRTALSEISLECDTGIGIDNAGFT